MVARRLTDRELMLVCTLLRGTTHQNDVDKLRAYFVETMSDGGMGSLRFVGAEERKFGSVLASAEFEDADGVSVSVTLNLDSAGELFELDIWKTNFAPLISIPEPQCIRATSTTGKR